MVGPWSIDTRMHERRDPIISRTTRCLHTPPRGCAPPAFCLARGLTKRAAGRRAPGHRLDLPTISHSYAPTADRARPADRRDRERRAQRLACSRTGAAGASELQSRGGRCSSALVRTLTLHHPLPPAAARRRPPPPAAARRPRAVSVDGGVLRACSLLAGTPREELVALVARRRGLSMATRRL
jgi:hypothetical protein